MARREVGRYVRPGDLDERLQALTHPVRDLPGEVRMIAYRAETRLAAAVAPRLSRPETARTMFKGLLASDSSILPDASTKTLTVCLLHQARKGQELASAPLLKELNETRALDPGTDLRLVYEFLPDASGEAGPSA